MTARRQSTLPKVKHTRICMTQSKNGYFTCRARHVKCDEAKPRCTRCSRSNRLCAGYQQRRITPTITMPSRSCISPSVRHELLARTGIGLLFSGLPSLPQTALESFDHELLQLGSTIPLVNACAYTLGIAHELRQRASYDAELEVFAASCHATALRKLREELHTGLHGTWPLVIACVVLAVAELLCERTRNAIFHLRGACDILKHRCGLIHGNHNSLILLLHAIDLHIAVHALSYSPMSKLLRPVPFTPHVYDLSSSRILLMQIRLEALSWAAAVLRFEETSCRGSQHLQIVQGRHIAHLLTWLEYFNNSIIPLYDTNNPDDHLSVSLAWEQALMLRMTCISALIHISTFLQGYQSRFDVHASDFQQIVLDAEKIIALRSTRTKGRQTSTQLVTGCGMNPALFLAAEKYRNISWRRRASLCLRQNGFELLFDGRRESAIAERLLVLEDSSLAYTSSTKSSQPVLISGCRILEDNISMSFNKVRLRLFREKRDATLLKCICACERENERLCEDCCLEVWDEEIQY